LAFFCTAPLCGKAEQKKAKQPLRVCVRVSAKDIGAKRCKRHRCKAKKLKFMHLLILLLQT
jgi:hypothetical protein